MLDVNALTLQGGCQVWQSRPNQEQSYSFQQCKALPAPRHCRCKIRWQSLSEWDETRKRLCLCLVPALIKAAIASSSRILEGITALIRAGTKTSAYSTQACSFTLTRQLRTQLDKASIDTSLSNYIPPTHLQHPMQVLLATADILKAATWSSNSHMKASCSHADEQQHLYFPCTILTYFHFNPFLLQPMWLCMMAHAVYTQV